MEYKMLKPMEKYVINLLQSSINDWSFVWVLSLPFIKTSLSTLSSQQKKDLTTYFDVFLVNNINENPNTVLSAPNPESNNHI